MLTIHLEGVPSCAQGVQTYVHEGAVTLDSLHALVQNVLTVQKDDVYFIHNGKKITDNTPVYDGVVRAVPRLLGGKGGFGSMLRAIGAQIEKTTNREACRDLSGRRLRDINEEQRLKNWISKKADREREALERKQKKLDKLRSEPKIEFKDKKYEEERSKLTEVVYDAVEKGFQASSSNSGPSSSSKKPAQRKGFMLEEEEFSDDDISSSSDESESGKVPTKRRAESESDSDEPSPAKRQHTEADSLAAEPGPSEDEKRTLKSV
ncbi:hypothetical protein ONE63_004828 [Megalurothrips usitatus]|uniref:SDE2-like domain-containing protein n=1 Tax=Megalurothrips usitatus TaxID=439358 RepID=A0AAV7X0X4_9NEOP|nr:hypothetical protein ONE63_004828 [Megalurothrips usitatus]